MDLISDRTANGQMHEIVGEGGGCLIVAAIVAVTLLAASAIPAWIIALS